MPRVQQYQGLTQTTQPVQGARMQAASVDLRPVSAGLSQIGQQYAELQDRLDKTEAESALVSFERDKNKILFDPDNGYFNKQGRDAYDGAKAASESLAQLQEQYSKNIKSQTARALFTPAAASHITSGNRDIMTHATRGIQAWEAATIKARVENSIENASMYWNSPDKLALHRELGRQSVMDAARIEGITGDALNERLQTYESSFARTAIEAAAEKSVGQAKDLMKQYESRIEGPDRVKLESMLDTKAKAEKTRYDGQYAVTQATTIVSQYSNRQEVIDEVNKITDPDRRDKTMREAMYQFGLKRQAESERQADIFQEAQKSGMSAVQYQSQYPDEWNALSAEQQQKLSSGKTIVTDQVTYSNLMLLPDDKLSKVNPADYITKLSTGDYSKLVTAVKSARGEGSDSDKAVSQVGRSRTAQTTAIVEQLYGKKSKQDIAQTNAFYALVDSETRYRESELGRSLSSQEYTALLGDLSRKVVKEGILFNSELDITDIPAEYVPQLTQLLQDNNIPVTADNLLRAYDQASK